MYALRIMKEVVFRLAQQNAPAPGNGVQKPCPECRRRALANRAHRCLRSLMRFCKLLHRQGRRFPLILENLFLKRCISFYVLFIIIGKVFATSCFSYISLRKMPRSSNDRIPHYARCGLARSFFVRMGPKVFPAPVRLALCKSIGEPYLSMSARLSNSYTEWPPSPPTASQKGEREKTRYKAYSFSIRMAGSSLLRKAPTRP